MKHALQLLVLLLVLATGSLYAKPITVVTYNAENLFDVEDDVANPRDDTYLPLVEKNARGAAHIKNCEEHNSGFYLTQCKNLDWSNEVYEAKLSAYAAVVLAMPETPDVLVIPETENKKVVQDLVDNHLAAHSYNVVQLDTSDEPDSRGIDVAILSKLPIISEPVAHKVDFKRDEKLCGATRDIVQVGLKLPNDEELHVFGVHFPSGRSPTRCRYRAFNHLNQLVSELPEGSLAVAAGDFNVNCNESTTDAYARLLYRGNWYASPLITNGCDAPGSSKFTDNLLDSWHTWSFLDQILVSKDLSLSKPSTKNWFADMGSFQTLLVHPSQYKVDDDDKGYIEPKRFDPVSKTGASDHWPVGLRLLQRRVD